jgi:transposase
MAKTSRTKKQRHLIEQVINPNAAGIDIGATEMVVAVPPGRDTETVRSFGTLTPDLHDLCGWLQRCNITSVAMESTGVYWMPLFGVLRKAGLEVLLVNAAQVRHCPARKTDVQDAQWLMQLHTAGLLRGSFHPPEDIRRLQGLMRERSNVVNDASAQVQRMQKALTKMNIQLHHVLSDLDGVSGLRMIEAILAGERSALALWKLRDWRCRTKEAVAIKALSGEWDEDIVEQLRRAHATWSHLQGQITVIDVRIEELLKGLRSEVEPCLVATAESKSAKGAGEKKRKLKKGEIPCDVRAEAQRLYGVDLGEIPGASTHLLATMLSEVGSARTLLGQFKSEKHFASWLGLCPDNRKSGGKILASRTRQVANRLAGALRLSAQALWQSKSNLGDWCRKMKARLGKAEGITATAHRIARIIYHLVAKQVPYDDNQIFQLTPQAKARRVANLQRQAQKLGLQIIVAQ